MFRNNQMNVELKIHITRIKVVNDNLSQSFEKVLNINLIFNK